jgi:hypothetical protein
VPDDSRIVTLGAPIGLSGALEMEVHATFEEMRGAADNVVVEPFSDSRLVDTSKGMPRRITSGT